MNRKRYILVIIVLAQFLSTSLWFAGNAVMPDLINEYNLMPAALANLTSAVQFGFILGTLLFASFTIADRYSPSNVFFACAVLGGVANLATTVQGNGVELLIISRFLTGFFLAGIYPVGMKIAADYHQKRLGKALGYLVGAVVLGTAFPHLLKSFSVGLPWRYVLYFTTALSTIGGVVIGLFVPDGPFRKQSKGVDFKASVSVFKNKSFRTAAIGYFGHMWELYAFWAFVPFLLTTYVKINPTVQLNIPLYSFLIIGVGSLSCVVGGYISEYVGSRNVALYALFLSGLCCLASPIIFNWPPYLFLVFIFIWGVAVVADSPQFSSLVAENAPVELKGTALTIVNSIGFAITILSIQLFTYLLQVWEPTLVFIVLAIGPLMGVVVLLKNSEHESLEEIVS